MGSNSQLDFTLRSSMQVAFLRLAAPFGKSPSELLALYNKSLGFPAESLKVNIAWLTLFVFCC